MPGRPRTPIGTWGDINTRKVKSGYEARTRYRDHTGRLRQISARAKTASGARSTLRDRLATLQKTTTSHTGITPTTTITDLLQRWLQAKDDVLPQTIDDYRQTITASLTPQLGQLTIQETTPGIIATHLDTLPAGVRTRARSIISQAFALAVSHDATPTNPVASLPKKKRPRPDITIITVGQLAHLRTTVKQWAEGKIDDHGNPKLPDKRSINRAPGLLEFVDLLLATGCRTGELAAARWKDLNLDNDLPTITIGATLVRTTGEGLQRQPFTKTKDRRVLVLPPYAVQILTRLQLEHPEATPNSPIFPSATGTFRDPTNINKQWRRARAAAGMPEVQFRTMRRTVATMIAHNTADKEAAAQLGHASVSMTRKHYILAKANRAPDLTQILERFAA